MHLADSLRSTADQRYFAVSPAAAIGDFQTALPDDWSYVSQAAGDLGRRMESWFRESLFSNADERVCCVLIGADCPLIQPDEIESAFVALEVDDVVLGPAEDGGYYLIGLGGPWRDEFRQLFLNMPWSSADVFKLTVDRIGRAGLRLGQLPRREDVDTVEGLQRLRNDLQTWAADDEHVQQLAAAIESILAEPAR